MSELADSRRIISISSETLKLSLSQQTDIFPCIRHPVLTPQACDKTSVCIGNVNPHASPVFHSVCKPGRRAPKFSQPFCCPTEPAQRLICSARWAALVSAGWLNRDSRRASAHPVKPFNPVNGKKARRLYKPTKPLRRAKIKLCGYARPSTKGAKWRSAEGEEGGLRLKAPGCYFREVWGVEQHQLSHDRSSDHPMLSIDKLNSW